MGQVSEHGTAIEFLCPGEGLPPSPYQLEGSTLGSRPSLEASPEGTASA